MPSAPRPNSNLCSPLKPILLSAPAFAAMAAGGAMLVEKLSNAKLESPKSSSMVQQRIQALEEQVHTLQQKLDEKDAELKIWATIIPGALFKTIMRTDGSLTVPYASDETNRLLGTAKDIENWRNVSSEDKPQLLAQAKDCGDSLAMFKGIYKSTSPTDHQVRWVQTRALPLPKDADGTQKWYGVSMDCTEFLKTQEALRASDERLQLALKGAEAGIWDWDISEQQWCVSREYQALLGYTGETWRDSKYDGHTQEGLPKNRDTEMGEIHPEDLDCVSQMMKGHLENGEDFDCELRFLCADGQYKWFRSCGSCIRDAEGKPFRMAGSLTDINDRKLAEMALRDALAAAKHADSAKSQFLANMSHELRTPLNSIMGYAALLADSPGLNDEQRNFVNTIRSSSDSLLTLVNDILDFSKIEAGKLQLEKSVFEIAGCVEDSVDLLATQAANKNLDLAYRIAPECPVAVAGDVSRIRQILVNLVANAVKFTSKGAVFVEVSSEPYVVPVAPAPDGDSNGADQGACMSPTGFSGADKPDLLLLHFAVHDTGIGVATDQQQLLFNAFSQIDAGRSRQYGGTGLGLAIVMRLAKMMRGSAWVESDPAVKPGATFRVTVVVETVGRRAAPLARQNSPNFKHCPYAKHTILLLAADASKQVMSEMLQRWGSTTLVASTMKEALLYLKNEAVGACIADRQILSQSEVAELAGLCKVIVLTGIGNKREDIHERVEAFVTKPVRPSQLYNALQACFAGSSQSMSPQSPQAQRVLVAFDGTLGTRYPLRLLIAEDNVINQQVLRRLLQRLGYASDVCANGLEAVQACQRQAYNVILMDLNMPICDGLEATRLILQSGSRTPIIIAVTAAALREEQEMCFTAGMHLYLSKPVAPRSLSQALTTAYEMLQRREGYKIEAA